MLGGLYTWARQIIVFLLVTELLFKLAGEKYRKYLKLAAGLCLVFLVAAPVLRRLSGTDLAGLLNGVGFTVDFVPGETKGEVAWQDGVRKEYEALVKGQLLELLCGMGLTVQKVQLWCEDGVIDGMSVWVSGDGKERKGQERISITEIVIALDGGGEEASGEDAVLEFVARMRIADFYDMDVSHINVIKEE